MRHILTHLQRQCIHKISDVNEVAIVTRLQSAYLGCKITKNQDGDMTIEYCTNLVNALKKVGKGLAAIYIHNMQRQEEYCTLDKQIKILKANSGNLVLHLSLNNKPTTSH